jgi:hypothetical protein
LHFLEIGNTFAFTAHSFGGIMVIVTLKKEGLLDIYMSLYFNQESAKSFD